MLKRTGARRGEARKQVCTPAGTIVCVLGLILFLLSSTLNVLADQTTQSEPLPVNDLVKILDIQIPGWKRVGNPNSHPIMEKDDPVGFQVNVNFTSGGIQTIDIDIISSKKDILDKILAKIPKGATQVMNVKGFEALQVSTSPSAYKDYASELYIRISDQCLVIINGGEIMDPDILVKIANQLDLKRLTTLSKQ